VSKIFDHVGFIDISSVRDLSGMERVVKGKWIR